jgi:NADPH-dependent ferric siderophore reductase
MPEGHERPVSRVYTPRIWDAKAQELSVDFIVHGEGPGSAWAEAAKAGDQAVISGPGGRFKVDPEAGWYLLACDQTGIPALATVLDALPPSMPARVYVEVEDAAEEQPLPVGDNVSVTWLHRREGVPMGAALLDALVRAQLPPRDGGRAWVACESSVMRDIRQHLIEERRYDRAVLHTHGYWKQGAENHPDHDYGED